MTEHLSRPVTALAALTFSDWMLKGVDEAILESIHAMTQSLQDETLPTAEVAEGISAAIVFDPSLSAEANVEQMKEAFERVNCGEVTCAVRKTELDGFSIKVGDYIGLDSKKIVSHSKTLDKAVMGLVAKLVGKDSEVITLYYGADVTKEESEKMTEAIEEKYPDCDVVCYYGGQPHYFYMISVE